MNKRGFTLVELIVVIAVIGILVLIATPKLIGYTQEAKKTNILNDIRVLENKIEEYLIKNDDRLPNEFLDTELIILETAQTEGKLYSVKGSVSVDNVLSGTFKEIHNNFIKSKLKGKFYVNNKAEVYYLDNIASAEVVENDPSDFAYMVVGNEIEITNYHGSKKDVVIPAKIEDKPVIKIGDFSFRRKELTSIKLPSTVIDIGIYAFEGNKLTTLNISENVISIRESSFRDNLLETVRIGNKVTNIGDFAFDSNNLELLTLGNNITNIGVQAFYNNKLTNVILPNSLKSIGQSAFRQNQITSITIGSNVELFEYTFGENFYNIYNNEAKTSATYITTGEQEAGTWIKQ
ncbi:leucine-rich repeat protein [uncultured Tissierella sp.]|uniref:leucine-rich repeat protein n=1 Tax=uncultured Tissierella sp. TaxID=448160 RepID=UPI002805AF18|nr:leucine-rich repeat protein [uncultured Tissierella sp.]MDU5080539.1 leucine-rich repeat protein [Bacillota bacterium]